MGYSIRKLLKISKGQISKKLIERTDIGILDDSGQEITNLFNSKYGALQSVSGTILKYVFGQNKKIKIGKILLPNSEDGYIAFNGTDHDLVIFDKNLNVISNVIPFSQVTEINYKNIKLSQNQDLILVCTGDNPIMEISLNLPSVTISVFSITAKNILKNSNISVPTLDPVLFRMGDEGLPTTPSDYGITIGDLVYPNSGITNPNTTFPWAVKRLKQIEPSVEWEDYNYTPSQLDVIKDVWNNKFWQYTTSVWIQPSLTATDIHYSSGWNLNATAGVVKITGTLLTLTAPAGINAKDYAEAILCGVKFDGENAIGVVRISEIAGTISGQNFNVTSIQGTALLSFDSSGTKTGFTIMYSEVKVFDGDYPNTTNNPTSTTNYPTNILFYQQRLIICGTRYNKSQMIFSEIGKYNSFIDDSLENSAFQLIIGSTEKEEILSVILNQGIQIFTKNNEWLVNDQTLTKSTGFIRNSSIGTNGVQPVIGANGVTLFPPQNGKGIIGFIYNYQSANYMTPYISLFTDLLDNPMVDIAVKRGLNSEDDNLIFICDEVGDLIIGNYLLDQNIQAFCRRKADNTKYLQSLHAESNISILTERNGYICFELLDNNRHSECSLKSISYNNVTGIITVSHNLFNGMKLNVYSEGDFIGEYEVSDNKIHLEELYPNSISEVGINIHSVFGSNQINVGNLTKSLHKTINSIKLALTDDTKEDFIRINGKYGRRVGNLLIFTRPRRPLTDCTFTIENDRYRCEILSIEIDVES